MASIQKTAKGYRAQIKLTLPGADKPVRDSQVFPTRREAVEWAAERERELRSDHSTPAGERQTLRQVFRRYADEISPKKRGERWEQIRLSAFETYFPERVLDMPIGRVTPEIIGNFRDTRSLRVGPGSVLRELALVSAVFESARLEWRLIDSNPCRDIRKPGAVRHRERVVQPTEVRAMLREMGYRRQGRISTTGEAVAVCMLMALRTGMRAGELCGLTWSNVHSHHVHLPMTKNGKPRDVPLSSRARRLIERMKGWDEDLVFGLKTASLDALFRKYRGRAGLEGFTFHDTRHTAATMLSRKVDVLTLCKIFGWSETRQALTYYNPKASTLAGLLD